VPRGFSGPLDHPRVETTVTVTGHGTKASAQGESVIIGQGGRFQGSFLNESVENVQ
jgi:hypothetical protein